PRRGPRCRPYRVALQSSQDSLSLPRRAAAPPSRRAAEPPGRLVPRQAAPAGAVEGQPIAGDPEVPVPLAVRVPGVPGAGVDPPVAPGEAQGGLAGGAGAVAEGLAAHAGPE